MFGIKPLSARMPAHYKWGILLVLLTILLRLPAIVHPKPIDDEGGYVAIAVELLHGETLYKSVVERKPPLLFWIYETIFFLVGPYNYVPFHLIGIAWILLTMWGLYAIGKELFDRDVGLVAGLLYTISITPSLSENLAFNGEVMMNLPIVWALFLAFKQNSSQYRWELVPSGVLLCLAFLIKQPAAISAIPVGIYLLLPSYRIKRNLKMPQSFLHASTLTISYFLTLGLAALLLYHQGILGETYYWIIKDHDVLHGPTDPIFWQLGTKNTLGYAAAWHPLLIVCFLSMWECCTRGARYWEGLKPELSALLILLGCSFIGASASGRFYSHYYIQLLPPLVLLGAPALTAIWRKTRSYRFFLLQPRTLKFLLGFTAAAFLLINTVCLWQLRPENELSRYVREHSKPEDKVFFWGKWDNLYAESERRPASRYIHYYPLTGYAWGSPFLNDPDYDTTDRIRPGAWDIFQEELTRSPPLFFIDTEPSTPTKKYPPSRYPFLRDMLANDYEAVFSTSEGAVYKRIAGARRCFGHTPAKGGAAAADTSGCGE